MASILVSRVKRSDSDNSIEGRVSPLSNAFRPHYSNGWGHKGKEYLGKEKGISIRPIWSTRYLIRTRCHSSMNEWWIGQERWEKGGVMSKSCYFEHLIRWVKSTISELSLSICELVLRYSRDSELQAVFEMERSGTDRKRSEMRRSISPLIPCPIE